MDSIFLLTGWPYNLLPSTKGGTTLLFFCFAAPYLFSYLLWLFFDWPGFARHKVLCSLAVSFLCLAVYWIQPNHYEGPALTAALYILVAGTVISFFAFFTSPLNFRSVRMKEWFARQFAALGRLARSLLGRFF